MTLICHSYGPNQDPVAWGQLSRAEEDANLRRFCPPAWWPDLGVTGDPSEYQPPPGLAAALAEERRRDPPS